MFILLIRYDLHAHRITYVHVFFSVCVANSNLNRLSKLRLQTVLQFRVGECRALFADVRLAFFDFNSAEAYHKVI
jgi:hypothetical protein